MFALRFLRPKKTREENMVADEEKPCSSQPSVADTPAATTAPVSAQPAEAGNQKKTKRTWMNRLFGCCEKKKGTPSAPQESNATADAPATSQASKKTPWWRCRFRCCRRSRRVAPAPDTDEEKISTNPPESSSSANNQEPEEEEEEDDQEGPFTLLPHQDEEIALSENMEFDLEPEESIQMLDSTLPSDLSNFAIIIEQVFLMAQVYKTTDPFGFPNIGQSCYMNSSLQSLLALEDLVRSISCMEHVWGSVPEAQLLRRLTEIRDCHATTDSNRKSRLLRSFKEVVSVQDPEFRDNLQKDAHEFLTSVLGQIRSLAPLLQQAAATMGRSYTCPVEEHLVFKMENTRTCKTCGVQSVRQEEFIDLSLDVVPGWSIEEMLEQYLMEVELEFRCKCGGTTSGLRTAFATLPGVLILQLKRLCFTPYFDLEKVDDPVELQRDLVVSSKEGGGYYSLVSAISHFGSAVEGHYICDSIHPEDCPDDPTDRWLTFNDSKVTETTGWSFSKRRQESAYILFYRRHV